MPMSKSSPTKVTVTDLSRFCKSSFTLTFVVEIIGIDVWHDCNEGWLDLGPVIQGFRLQYQLYYGQSFDVDILVWPHTAKVFCGLNYGWVRTWQFLERRWLTFSIRHAFPVRVVDLRNFVATVTLHSGTGSLSANAKSDKNTEVYLPPLAFLERRQFGPVKESEEGSTRFFRDLIWKSVVNYIPTSYMDGIFDTPYPVSDVRHQDAVLGHVQNAILNRTVPDDIEVPSEEQQKPRRESKVNKEKKKPAEAQKIKFEIKLSGDSIIAGAGRVVPFESIGDRPTDLGEIIVLIASTNLPAQDDLPVAFVNVGILTDIPLEHFAKQRISHVYTRWTINEEEHCSEYIPIKSPKTEVNFNDHHSVPLPVVLASEIMATFLDEPFRVEVHGIRALPQTADKTKFFGYEKLDRDFGISVPPPLPNQDTDIIIAQTKINGKPLSKSNGLIRGDFPLYPPEPVLVTVNREGICTNDINAVRAKMKPALIIQPGDILEAQMTLEVSLGFVGCKPKSLTLRYSRLYCLVSDPEAIMAILRQITEINESVSGTREELLTGFGLDTGDTVMLFLEGPRDGYILQVWEMTDEFYPNVKPTFSTSDKYRSRLYPELLLAAMPFNVMKMFVPLSVLLGLTPIYTRPALPLPTRSALLKIGRLVASKFSSAPCRQSMPTIMELKSFRLELCVAPRPPPATITEIPMAKLTANYDRTSPSVQSATVVNWENKS